VDWSGCRALLFASTDGSLRLQGERLNDITDQFPEVATASAALGGRVAVLDGVIAVLDPEGRPDLAALGHRLVSGPLGAPVAVYLATDLLHLDGAPSISWPLERRLAALASLVMPDARIQLTEPVYGEGDALADAASQRGLQALLARRGSTNCGACAHARRVRAASSTRDRSRLVGTAWATRSMREAGKAPSAASST